jgi:integrase/recombinase XerC
MTESKELAIPESQALVIEDYVEKAQRVFALALAQKSESTVKAYQASLRDFARFLGMEDPRRALGYLLSMNRLDADLKVTEYLGWLTQNEKTPSTIRVRLSALKFYVRTANRAAWVDWVLTTEGPPQETVKEVEGPTPEQFARIMAVVDELEGELAVRNKLLVYMLSFMALRVSEALSIDMDHVDLDRRTVAVKRKGSRHKRDRRTVPTKTFELLEEWVELRGDEEGPLFCTSEFDAEGLPNRLHRSSAWKIVRRIGKLAGMPELHPHAFRHFSTTEALEVTDGDTRGTMKHTGHKSERMINIYEDKRTDAAGQIAQQIEDRWMSEDEPQSD